MADATRSGGCETLYADGVAIGIACSRGAQRQRCQTPGCHCDTVALCDHKLEGKRVGSTCDRRMCRACRNRRGSRDFCAAHARRFDAELSSKV